MKNTFKKGLILGGLLTVAAVAGFSMTKEGEELTEELREDLKTLAKNLKKNLHQLEDVTKENFNELVTTLVDDFARKKKLASDAKNKLITALQSRWHEMEAEYSK